MSGTTLLACSAVALCLGLPVMVASGHLEARHRAGAVADAAALAAADASSGWNDMPPCAAAEVVANSMGATVVECTIDLGEADARIVAEAGSPPYAARAMAHAASAGIRRGGFATGQLGANGWAWPSDSRGISQSFHDGYAIDLMVTPGGALYAPFDGVVVVAGPDGGAVPPVCQLQLAWWHGPNSTVVIRHEYAGQTIYSSHNHIDPESPSLFGAVPGTRVVAGQQVASAGMSGCTSGPHTHFTLATTQANSYPDLNPFEFIGEP